MHIQRGVLQLESLWPLLEAVERAREQGRREAHEQGQTPREDVRGGSNRTDRVSGEEGLMS